MNCKYAMQDLSKIACHLQSYVSVLAPNPQNSKYPSNPRMKWKFHNKIPERASTDDGEVEVQHLSLPSGEHSDLLVLCTSFSFG